MRREERVTVQGPVKKQRPQRMSHRGMGVWFGLGSSRSPSPPGPPAVKRIPGPDVFNTHTHTQPPKGSGRGCCHAACPSPLCATPGPVAADHRLARHFHILPPTSANTQSDRQNSSSSPGPPTGTFCCSIPDDTGSSGCCRGGSFFCFVLHFQGQFDVGVAYREGTAPPVLETLRTLCHTPSKGGLPECRVRRHEYPGPGPAPLDQDRWFRAGGALLLLYGLAADAEVRALLRLAGARRWGAIAVPFADLAWHWEAVEGHCGARGCADLGGVVVSTSLFNWRDNASAALVPDVRFTHPLQVMGHFVGVYTRALLDSFQGKAVTGADLLDAVYERNAVQIVRGIAVGPFDRDQTCHWGAQELHLYDLQDFMAGGKPLYRMDFAKCRAMFRHMQSQTGREEKDDTFLGLDKKEWLILGFVALGLAATVPLPVCCGVRWYLRRRFAPTDRSAPFAAMFVSMKGTDELWERYSDQVANAFAASAALITSTARRHKCHYVKQVGSAFLIVAAQPHRLLACAKDIQQHPEAVMGSMAIPDLADAPAKDLRRSASDMRVQDVEESRSRIDSRSLSPASPQIYSAPPPHLSPSLGEFPGIAAKRGSFNPIPVPPSPAALAHAARDLPSLAFGIGIHTGHGRIARRGRAYDYGGEPVVRAAILADLARRREVLGSGAGLPAEDRVPHGTHTHQNRQLQVWQYHPPDETAVVAPVPPADDEPPPDAPPAADPDPPFAAGGCMAGAFAALELQESGVTVKKVTVLSGLFAQQHALCAGLPCSAFAAQYKGLVARVAAAAEREKGHLHAFQGGRFTVTFNDAAPCPL